MTLTMLASQIAPAAWSPHLSRAWDSDWSTGMVVIPVPPPFGHEHRQGRQG